MSQEYENLSQEIDAYIRRHYRPEGIKIKDFIGGLGGRTFGVGMDAHTGTAKWALSFLLDKLELTFSEKLMELIEKKGNDFLLKEDKALLQDVYKKLLEELSYYVTRQTIKSRTAEARLVARLFDIDNVMKSLFGDAIEETLESVQEKWEWNSRYWEQRALAIIGTNLDKALLHAQQAVAIERHPNTLTTLSKVQFRIMETVSDDLFVKKFEVAAKSALEAMNLETKRNYHSIQPLIVLKNGLTKYAESHDPNKINSNMRYDIKGALSFYLGDRHFMRTEENELNALIHML